MATTVLVTGAAGQVGVDLVNVLHGVVPAAGVTTGLCGANAVGDGEFEVVALDRSALDVTDGAACSEIIGAIEPEVVVHLAAYTAVDRAESEQGLALAVNEMGTRNVAAAAEATGAHLVALSTDYVFPGDLGRELSEDDPVGPLNVYGVTKHSGELACPPSATIVRTSWVAGVTGRSVVHLAKDAAHEGRELRFVDDQIGTWTSSADLAAGLVKFIRDQPGGVVHVAGAGAASWFEVVQEAVAIAGGSRTQVVGIKTIELDPAPRATRPQCSPLVSRRLAELDAVPLPPWQEGLERLVLALTQ